MTADLIEQGISAEDGDVIERMDDVEMAFYEKSVREIARGDTYICMICTVEMDYTCSMYACSACYRVYDYECIREWAVKSTKRTVEGTWKCPNCSHVSNKIPPKDKPRCWCGKVIKPDPNPMDPNSCGQTCNARTCRHGCMKLCHLGPHEECMRNVNISCRCGKHKKGVFCYQSQALKARKKFRCEDECGKLLSCKRHLCKKVCHSKSCGNCPEIIESSETELSLVCYCGRKSLESMRCKDIKLAKKQSKDEKGTVWRGFFSCGEKRSVLYSCRKHSFVEGCKPKPTLDGQKQCPFSPKLLKTCPCGKTPLKQVKPPRKVCTDPIFTCESKCDKELSCGSHKCPFTCHEGPCMDPCTQVNLLRCSCEQRKFVVPCGFEQKPQCNRKCESLMSCRRHRCTERCCSGKPLAEIRKRTPYGTNELHDESLVEAQHICLKDCNLLLSCKVHRCQRKCHPGKCPPCLESSSDDLVCPCGKTVVEAPVRCGTKLPPCDYPCIKVVQKLYECGHKPMPHTCHSPDQPCPPCTAPVLKKCKCEKKDKVRTVCFQNDVSCGQKCGKPLENCIHGCQKLCHLPGECQKKCNQMCNSKKAHCDHKCTRPCHRKEDCPDVPCTAIVKVACTCGLHEDERVCGAYSKAGSASSTELLPCDDACEIRKRQIELKKAFGISNLVDVSADNDSPEYKRLVVSATTFEEVDLPFTEPTLNIYSKHIDWCSSIESVLNSFIDDCRKTSLHFKPMKQPQRNFIHELVKAYKLYSESQDREPKRSVYIKKMEGNGYSKPILSLKEALPLYESFKQVQKERKIEQFQAKKTTTLINFTSQDPPKIELGENNAFCIKNLVKGTTSEDLERIFSVYLKHTLVKNPKYFIHEESKKGFIFPEDYCHANVNVADDMERLVGHFDYIAKESMIAEGIELCRLDEEILRGNNVNIDSA